MKTNAYGWLLAVVVAAAGCTTDGLPRRARVVGGGLKIDYEAPTEGTVVLRETTSGRSVATRSLRGNGGLESRFSFDPLRPEDGEALRFALGELPADPVFVLYFVPAR